MSEPGSQSLSEPKLYFVWGGVFTDTQFRTLEPGTEECYGPFHDPATAKRVWDEKIRRNLDTAQHRVFIISVPQPTIAPPAKRG